MSLNTYPWNQSLWQSLINSSGHSNHALLFNGSISLGKRELALALAHHVLSENNNQADKLFHAASHPDLHILAPECYLQQFSETDLFVRFAQRYIETHSGKPKRNITIEQVRKINNQLTTFPHIGSHRVVLILVAETMNRNAANALLKNLEEPPANTLFILVTNELSKLAITVRSRCNLVNFRTPDYATAYDWLKLVNQIPTEEINNYLAMANNQPLLSVQLYQNNYIEHLKSIFIDVNGLWGQHAENIAVAKNWQEIGGLQSIEILQKLATDLLRASLTSVPSTVFFPIQYEWIKSVSKKISMRRLLSVIDALNNARSLLDTTVDELLVLETVSNKIRQMPRRK